MKAIMYHYVQRFNKLNPYLRFLDIKNFCKQLDYFEQNFGFVRREDWIGFLKNGTIEKSKNKILLTFDDGLKCHYKYVFPELQKRGLFGFFYIPTLPFQRNKILDVHKIHLLCGSFQGIEVYRELIKLVNNEMIPDRKREEFSKTTYKSQKNYKFVIEIKRILNYFIDYKFRENLIDNLAKNLNYQFNLENFYLSKDNIKEMDKAGHIIGSHTVNHFVMSKISRDQQLNEIKQSFSFINSIISNNQKSYCHPYGGFYSFNNDTVDLLNEENVKYSFNVESRDIEDNDFLKSIQFLPRYDCNEFPFGEAS